MYSSKQYNTSNKRIAYATGFKFTLFFVLYVVYAW